MSILWNWLNQKGKEQGKREGLFLFLNSLIFAVLGFIIWFLFVRKYAFSTWDWGLCFAGYPGLFIGFIGGFFFLCRKK